MDLRKVFVAAFAIVSQSAFSSFQAPDITVLLSSANNETAIINDLQDEQMGLRTGSLNYSTVDVQLSGLGPDINVRRTLAKTSIGPVEFGSWILDVPRIVLSTNPNGWPAGGARGVNPNAGICNDYSNPKYKILGGGSQSANWHTEVPELFLGTGESEKLITLDSSLAGSRFPAGTKYVTTSNTIVSCIEVNGRFDGYRVKTPDGLTYELTKLSVIPGDFYGGKAGKNIISVSKIEDQMGNEVIFSYREVKKPSAHSYSKYAKPNRFYVEEISATDGRRVVLNYDDDGLEGRYPLITSVEVKNAGDIFGSAVWQYNYTGLTSAMKSDYCHFLSASPAEKKRCNAVSKRWYQGTYLEEVVRPDKATWEFDYRGPIVGSVLDCCTVGGAINHLSRVKFPSGGVARYQYGQLDYEFFDDSTLVYETPVVKKRTLHDPVTNQTNVWEYTYSKNSSANYTRTEVNRPDSSKHTHWFYRTGTYRGLNYKSEVKQAGDRIRLVQREFEAGTNLGSYIGHAKFPTRYVGLKERVLDDLYRRTVVSRDELFRETVTKETANATRVIENSYLPISELKPNSWMLNLVEKTTVKEANGDDSATVDREFYGNGLVKSLERFGVLIGEYEYTPEGELLKKSTRASQEIAEEYSDYNAGRPGIVEFNDGARRSFSYDGFGNVISETDEMGNQTTSKFDALGRIRSLTRPSLSEISYEYQPFTSGQPSKTVMNIGDTVFSTEHFDGFGRLLASVVNVNSPQSTQYNDNKVEQYRYDFDGNVEFSSHPTSGSISSADFLQYPTASGFKYTYDVLSRLEKRVDTSTGGSIEYCYDQICQYGSENYNVGFGELVVDERGYKTLNKYDCYSSPDECVLGEVKRKVNNPSKVDYVVQAQSEEPLPDEWVTINIDRDILGNAVRVENDGVVRSFEYYPGTSLVQTQTQPESLPTTYSYYPNGSIRSSQQGKRQKSYQFNKRGLLTSVDTPEGNLLEADYYPTGKIENAWTRDDEETVRTHFSYTNFGSVSSHQDFPSAAEGPTVYNYNSFGHVEQMIYPHGDVVDYSPDLLGRATRLDVNGEELANITRRTDKDILSLANDIVVEKKKNERGLDTRLLVKPNRVEVGLPDRPTGSSILDYSYSYDRSNNLIQRQDKLTPSFSKNFTYDGLSRLVWDGYDYRYDANSNITFKSGTVINYKNNRVQSIEGDIKKKFGHDDYGRLTSSYIDQELVRSIKYNDTDRVESITSAGATSIYSYDAFGRLFKTSSLQSDSDIVSVSHLSTDLFGRVLEKETDQDPMKPDRLVRYFYIENSLVAEKEEVKNSPPVVEVQSVDTAEANGQEVVLKARATDIEDPDDELSDSIVWISDKDGNIGSGANTSSNLSVGVHKIHAEVEDSGGLVGKSPAVSISIAPELTLNAKVREISKLNPDGYKFVLSVEPAINGDFDFFFNGDKSVEGTMNVAVSGVDFGADNTLYVCHRNSVVCSNTIDVSELEQLNDRPEISKISASGNANKGEFVTFTATATDREEGSLTGAIQWFSSKVSAPSTSSTPLKQVPPGFFDGDEAVETTGGRYSTMFNKVGSYRITAKVTDNRGLEETSSFDVTRNMTGRIAEVQFVPDSDSPYRVPSFFFTAQVTSSGVSKEHLQFYIRNGSSSWKKTAYSKSLSGNRYHIGLFPADYDLKVKVCDKAGNFCSAPFSN